MQYKYRINLFFLSFICDKISTNFHTYMRTERALFPTRTTASTMGRIDRLINSF